MKVIIFALGICTLVCSSAFAKKEIVWLKFGMPPAWITDGKLKNQGMIDHQRKILQDRLSEYGHKELVVTPNRFKAQIRNPDKTYCNAAWLADTGDDKFLRYSKISDATVPTLIVTTKNMAGHFGRPGEVISLKKILSNKKLKVGIVAGRPYGGDIDKVLKGASGQSNIESISGDFTKPLEMMLKGHVDYSLDYPEGAVYFSRQVNREGDVVTFLTEESSKCFPYYVVCVNTDEGRRVISKVNTILSKVQNKEEFLEASKKWYPKSIIPYWLSCRKDAGLK